MNRPWDAKIDYYTQQSFQSPSMEKTRYSMTKTVIKYYVPTNPVPQKVLEGKPQLKKVNCTHKAQATYNPPPVLPKRRNTQTLLSKHKLE